MGLGRQTAGTRGWRGTAAGLFLIALCGVLVSRAAGQATERASGAGGEQVDKGQIAVKGANYGYVIRRLPLTAFPDLPGAIRDQLEKRRCMVPQPFDARRPGNVVSGSFGGVGKMQWAVLCSSGATTTLLVFLDEVTSPNELAKHTDLESLTQPRGSGVLGYAWAITMATPGEVQRVSRLEPGEIEHEGLRDELYDQSSTVHYFYQGKWIADSYY